MNKIKLIADDLVLNNLSFSEKLELLFNGRKFLKTKKQRNLARKYTRAFQQLTVFASDKELRLFAEKMSNKNQEYSYEEWLREIYNIRIKYLRKLFEKEIKKNPEKWLGLPYLF